MKVLYRVCSVFLLLGLSFLSLSPAVSGPPPFPDELKYPNIVPSSYQFGTFGNKRGEFNDPQGMTIGHNNLVYIADTVNHRIQVLTKSGKVKRSFGRVGSSKGKFSNPHDVAVAADGSIVVADTGNHRVQVFNKKGKHLRQWGGYGRGNGEFNEPQSLTVHKDKVYVSDTANDRIQVFSLKGEYLNTFGRRGQKKGEFRTPRDLAVDEDGNIYVADAYNNRIQKFDAQGKYLKQWGAWGSYSGLMATPSGLSYRDGKLYVADLINHRIQVFDTEGKYLYQWGRHPVTAHEGNGRIHYPTRVDTSITGDFSVVCEPFENRCQTFEKLKLASVKNVNDSAWWDKATRFHYGTRVAIQEMMMAISEPDTHAVLVFDVSKKTPEMITTIGGQGTKLGEFVGPSGLVVDGKDGTILASDSGNQRVQMFRLQGSPEKSVKFMKGTASFIKAFDFKRPANKAKFALEKGKNAIVEPSAMRRGPDGNIYMADPRNGRILVLNKNFKLVRKWGKYGSGPGEFKKPLDLAFSKDGKILYVVDSHNFRVQAFDTKGKYLFSFGKPGPEKGNFVSAFGISAGKDGHVYVTDVGVHRVQKFTEKGKFVSTWGSWGGDAGQFYKPKGVAQDNRGRVYVIDFGNHRGQIFTAKGKYITTFGIGEGYQGQPRP